MRKLQLTIPVSLGDNIMIRGYLESVKNNYDLIEISHYAHLIEREKDDNPKYHKFIKDLGLLLFNEHPFKLSQEFFGFKDQEQLLEDLNIEPCLPNLSKQLCKGKSLNIEEKYITISTKVRYLNKYIYDEMSGMLWSILKDLSKKYKIVVVGERKIEYGHEYGELGIERVYSIYNDIIKNISSDRLIDLSVEALGWGTSPSLENIQQDCLIIKEAEFNIVLGIGGNFCMALSCGNLICIRNDELEIADKLYNKNYLDKFITKNKLKFLNKLNEFV